MLRRIIGAGWQVPQDTTLWLAGSGEALVVLASMKEHRLPQFHCSVVLAPWLTQQKPLHVAVETDEARHFARLFWFLTRSVRNEDLLTDRRRDFPRRSIGYFSSATRRGVSRGTICAVCIRPVIIHRSATITIAPLGGLPQPRFISV